MKNLIFLVFLIFCSCSDLGTEYRVDRFHVKGLGQVTVYLINDGHGNLHKIIKVDESGSSIIVNGLEYTPK